MVAKEKIVENPKAFALILSLFLVSIIIAVSSFIFTGNNKEEVVVKNVEQPSEAPMEDVSLEEYFKDSSSTSNDEDSGYLINDPFKDMCSDTSGDGKPAYKSNTVCLR